MNLDPRDARNGGLDIILDTVKDLDELRPADAIGQHFQLNLNLNLLSSFELREKHISLSHS
jgi:hypothetical protein